MTQACHPLANHTRHTLLEIKIGVNISNKLICSVIQLHLKKHIQMILR